MTRGDTEQTGVNTGIMLQREAARAPSRGEKSAGRFGFWLLLAYLALEYGRPQATLPFLEKLHLPAMVTILIAASLFIGRRVNLGDQSTKLFVYLLGLFVLHLPLADNTYWAFHIGRTMFALFLVYLCFIGYVDSYDRLNALLIAWLGIHVYLAISGVMKQGVGIGGFLEDENDFCMALNMIVPFPFFLFLSESNRIKKIVYAALAGLFLATIVLTVSRGGFIGLAAVALYCFLRSPRKLAATAAISIMVVCVLLFAPKQFFHEIESISEGASEGTTGEDRVYTWVVGWEMFQDNPMLGVGQGNFPYRFKAYETASGNEEGLRGRSRAGRAAHSLYFTLLPELGLVGAVLVLLMAYRTWKDMSITRRLLIDDASELAGGSVARRLYYICFAVEASLIGYFVSGIFISILYYPNLWLMIGFAIALRNVAQQVLATRLEDQEDLPAYR